MQQTIDVFRELAQLLGRSKAPRYRTVFFHRDGQIAGRGQRAVLHRLQDRRILEHHAAAAQLLFARFLDLFRRGVTRAAQHRLARGRIEDARRHDLLPAEKCPSLFLERKEVEQHLKPQTVAQLGKVEALLACLVVHHAKV